MNEFRAYLYGIKEDFTLTVQEGYFHPGHNRWSKTGRFVPDHGNFCFVSNEPGELHYKKLWLKERDDTRVLRLYLEYHRHKIEDLERQLDMHRQAGVALLKEIENNDHSI